MTRFSKVTGLTRAETPRTKRSPYRQELRALAYSMCSPEGRFLALRLAHRLTPAETKQPTA